MLLFILNTKNNVNKVVHFYMNTPIQNIRTLLFSDAGFVSLHQFAQWPCLYS